MTHQQRIDIGTILGLGINIDAETIRIDKETVRQILYKIFKKKF